MDAQRLSPVVLAVLARREKDGVCRGGIQSFRDGSSGKGSSAGALAALKVFVGARRGGRSPISQMFDPARCAAPISLGPIMLKSGLCGIQKRQRSSIVSDMSGAEGVVLRDLRLERFPAV